uniref:Putative capsid protein n=1 Tax=aquatic metagenome TaxID=1169740 RepID=A0A7D5BDM8_9ZZZZ
MPVRKNKTNLNALTSAVRSLALTTAKKVARRPSGVVSGRGYYKGFGRGVGTLIGGVGGGGAGYLAGGFPGAVAGSKMGSYLGGQAGDMGSRITGFGAYKVNYNSIIGNVPAIRNSRSREGATIVRHKEFIGDVKSSVNFEIQYELPINAAQSSTFPWMSQIAANYEQYEIQGMLFEFVSSSGDTTAGSQTLGDVLQATQYNSLEPSFANKQQMLNQEFSIVCKPSVNALHPIECAPKQTTLELLYTRPGVQAANSDIRLYDLGVYTLATQGQQTADQMLGSLYVTYEIALMKPKLVTGSGLGASLRSVFTSDVATENVNNWPFGALSSFVPPTIIQNDLNLSFPDSKTLRFPVGIKGAFKIDFYWKYQPGIKQTQWIYQSVPSQCGPVAPKLWDGGTNSVWCFPTIVPGDSLAGPYAYSMTLQWDAPATEVQDLVMNWETMYGPDSWDRFDAVITQIEPVP